MNNKSDTLPWTRIDSFVGNKSNPALTTYRPCPICGSLHYRNILTFNDFQFFSDSTEYPKRTVIQNVQCQDCHAVYLNPCYTTIGFDYLFSEAGRSYGSTEGRPAEQREWLDKRNLLDEGTVFLDVGCYDGRLLSHLPKNIRRVGVDIDEPAIKQGQARYGSEGVELINGAFESFSCSVQPDVISMFHVLEHLANPYAVLKHLRLMSHAETRLVVEVPIIEFGKTNDINGFFSVQHMTHFSSHSLSQLLLRAGWFVLEKQKISGYNGYRILAKPGEINSVIGIAADIGAVYEYLSHWYRSLMEIEQKISAYSTKPRMVIWGGGMHSEFLYQASSLFSQNRHQQYIVVDSDPLKQGKSWRGLPIFSPEVLSDIDWSECHLLISSYGGQESIAAAAENNGVPNLAIQRLYDAICVY